MKTPSIEALRWLRQAQSDMEVVQTLLTGKHYAQACFYSQQVAEKALKAVLYSQGTRMVLGHSIQDLSRQCVSYDSGFSDRKSTRLNSSHRMILERSRMPSSA
jgi:HEPN domain-containing protein